MQKSEFLRKYIGPFSNVQYVYKESRGFIAWRRGTGDNVELLHIRTFERGRGYGRKLFYEMLDELHNDPPYHSIFGFTRVGNYEAHMFYGALGFELQKVNGLYQEGEATLFLQRYERLLQVRREHEDFVHR